MGNIYVKSVEPCIWEDGLGNVVDMSNTEFYGDELYSIIDKKTGVKTYSVRKANPDRVFQVVDSEYWLKLITKKQLIQVEKPKPKRGKTASQEDTDEESLN